MTDAGRAGDVQLSVGSGPWPEPRRRSAGATSSTYTLVQADVGAKITVTVSWTDQGGTAESLTSTATAAVVERQRRAGRLGDDRRHGVAGRGADGEHQRGDGCRRAGDVLLSVEAGPWPGHETAISDATSSTYTLVQADVGATITVTVSWTDLGGTSESLTSTPTAAVANVNDLPVASAIEKTTDEDTALTFAGVGLHGCVQRSGRPHAEVG